MPGLWFVSSPIRSVRPPRADNDESAFNAPGLVSNWASGMAPAKGEGVVEAGVADELDEMEPPPGFEGFWASRFCFWSSTLMGSGCLWQDSSGMSNYVIFLEDMKKKQKKKKNENNKVRETERKIN